MRNVHVYTGNARVAYWHMYGGELSRVHSGFININTFFYVQHFISQYFLSFIYYMLLACRRAMLEKLLLKFSAMPVAFYSDSIFEFEG